MAGNENSGQRKDKLIREALRVAALRVVDGDPKGRIALAIAAEKVVNAAVEGDLAAFKEMADRIDGKAVQQMDVTTTHERTVAEWTESELDRAIARLKATSGGTGGKAAKAASAPKSDRVH
jgi:hypothetical protein